MKHLHTLVRFKEQYAGFVNVQIIGFSQQGLLRSGQATELFQTAFSEGLDVMGCDSNPNQ